VAYGAHIGGFVAGAALVWLFRRRVDRGEPVLRTIDDDPRRRPWR
jgi:membrane associated rhomboid family serine protease